MPADIDPTELLITLAALAIGASIIAAMAWLERQPRKSLEPRLIPTTWILFLGAAIALVALVHLINILGLHTGRR